MSDLIDDFNQILQATVDQTTAVNDLEVTYRGKVQEIDDKVDAAVADTQQAIVDMNADAQPHIDAMKEFVGSELLHMQGEVDMETRREMVNNLYPSSGVVHGGLAYKSSKALSSRLGLWTHPGATGGQDKLLHLGYVKTNNITTKKSPTDHTVINMNGFLVHLKGRAFGTPDGNDFSGMSWFTPPGELGTRVYNRGTADVIDYLYEADPKYPDNEQPLGSTPTAEGITFNEAVYRAHDKYQKNANGRHGVGSGNDKDTGWTWTPGQTTFDPDTNRWSISDVGETDGYSFIRLPDLKAGEYVKVSCKVISKTNITTWSGVRFRAYSSNYLVNKSSGYTSIDKPIGDVPEGEYVEEVYQCLAESANNYIGILVSATDSTMVVEDLKIELCNEDGVPLLATVTEREDVYTIEGFLRPIIPGDFVYPYGAVDSAWSTMCGISTREDDVRPDSFFAHYKGQENPWRGRGVVFHDRTPEEQGKLCSDPEHNIYRMADGQVVQFCYRPKVYRGYGNGPWDGIDQNETYMQFGSGSGGKPFIQGYGDNEDGEADQANRWLRSNHTLAFKSKSSGNADALYHAYRTTASLSRAYNAEAYSLILCTIPTLNQGAYSHKNRLGTGEFQVKDQYTYLDWKSVENVIGREPRPEEHFLLTEGESTGFIGRHATSGSKESGRSSRPDGKWHDRLYSGGYGAPVIRHPYFGALKADTLEAAEEVRCEVMSNQYPGMERAPRSHIIEVGSAQMYVHGSNTINTKMTDNPEIYNAMGAYTGYYNLILTYVIKGARSGNMLPNMINCHMFFTKDGVDYAFKLDGVNWSAHVLELNELEGYPSLTDIPVVDNIINVDDCIIVLCYEGRYQSPHRKFREGLFGPEVSGQFETSVVYGNPKDLVQINRYKNGWDGYWGGFTDVPGDLKLPRMSEDTLDETMSGDLGTSWSKPYGGNPPINNNQVTLTEAMQGKVWEVNFLANASVFKFSSDLKLAHGKESIGKLHFVKSTRWDYGGLNLEYFTSKIPTVNSVPIFQTSEVHDVTVNPTGTIYSSDAVPLKHDPVNFGLQPTTAAIKLVMVASLNDNRLTLQGRSQELISNQNSADITTIIADGSSVDLVKGKLYIFKGFDNESMNNLSFTAGRDMPLSVPTTLFNNHTLDPSTGKVLRTSDGAVGFGGMRLFNKAYYWGDSNYLVVGNQVQHHHDNNGNLAAICSAELILPYGTATI